VTDSTEKSQWELVADAVATLGGRANRAEIFEYLKRSLPDIPFNTVAAELHAVSVNAPARTSYHAGRQPRRTDSGNRYDRLFKVGMGEGAYYEVYDPKVHGVWEIYADPDATSTNKTSIRQVGGGPVAYFATLTAGAIDPGNNYLPLSDLPSSPFPKEMIGNEKGDQPGKQATFRTETGWVFQSDVRSANGTSGRLRTRMSTYYKDIGATPGDRIRIDHEADGTYMLRHEKKWARAIEQPDFGVAEPRKGSGSPMTLEPINKILFGPPGTGKTYRTVNEALRILDPELLATHGDRREALKTRFDELAAAGRIRFVTFHQSFSYEDFVEGMRADVDGGEGDENEGGIRYRVEPGVFREICDTARSRTVALTGSGIDISGRRIWKISLGDANGDGLIYDECMRKNLVLIGFGAGADLTGVSSRAEIVDRLRAAGAHVESGDYPVSALDQFVRRVQVGDLVVVSQGNLRFRAIGEVTGGYIHLDRDGADTFAQARPVRWLRRYEPARPYTDLMDGRFSQMTIYEPGSIKQERLAALLAPEQAESGEPEARVLIIDEINRGNVSRIFGELITLIEPSKREGCAESLKVILPYSRDEFSVPRNLHIIGTMNTADRSLAGLDVALRRRFEFIEMLPDIEALRGIEVEGVPIDELLSRMNRRIEVLLGRDYMLGHAYFMRLEKTPTIELLAEIFRRQVLPLLQEYFFEDWQKIAWVLNEHRKQDEALKFLRQSTAGMAELFGDVELPGEGKLWSINPGAFANPNAYLAIITAPQSAKAPQAIA